MGVLSGELFTKYFIEHWAAGFRFGQSDPSFRTSFGIDVSYFKFLHRVRTITLVNRSVKLNETFIFALKKHGRSIYLYRHLTIHLCVVFAVGHALRLLREGVYRSWANDTTWPTTNDTTWPTTPGTKPSIMRFRPCIWHCTDFSANPAAKWRQSKANDKTRRQRTRCLPVLNPLKHLVCLSRFRTGSELLYYVFEDYLSAVKRLLLTEPNVDMATHNGTTHLAFGSTCSDHV